MMGIPQFQDERRLWLIEWLLSERADGSEVSIPHDVDGQRALLRALMNVRPPEPVTEEFLAVQDAYLQERRIERGGIVQVENLDAVDGEPSLRLWRGDITLLAADAIVNAANSQMLGCFAPGHHCIDNAIHTFAGVQLRLECARIMGERSRPEPTATATITAGYNLPASHVIHTVGPIAQGRPTTRHRMELARCYRSCLDLATEHGLGSVAFCCISTGVFGFPQREAAGIAVATVREWLHEATSGTTVVFNVFLESDLAIYKELLGA